MIVETVFSTLDKTGKPNFAPMGIEWGDEFLAVRPFRNTRTCQNLLAKGFGVANITDNVLVYVQCALYDKVLPCFPAAVVPGVVYEETCSWLELEVTSQAGSDERVEMRCRVLHRGRRKDFVGFCRARNAVIEATILATRLAFHDRKTVIEDLARYWEIVEKTGDETEKCAFRLVQDYVRNRGNDD